MGRIAVSEEHTGRASATWRRAAGGGAILATAVVVLVLPTLVGASVQVALTNILYAVLLGIGWNVIGGFGGQFALGQTLFLGIGAYSTAWLLNHGVSGGVGLVAGMALSMVVAFGLGNLLFRRQLRDFYFALVTLAFAYGLGYTVANVGALGGPNGLVTPLLNSTIDLIWSTTRPYYYFALVLVVVSLIVSWRLYHSAAGWRMRAVVADESSAVAVGIDPVKSKLQSFLVSAALASAAGTFYVCQNQLVNSHTVLSLDILLLMLAGPIIGGLGTIAGPIIGGIVVGGVQQGTLLLPLTSTLGAVITEGVFGLALVVIPLVAPGGIMGWVSGWRTSRKGMPASGPVGKEANESSEAAR